MYSSICPYTLMFTQSQHKAQMRRFAAEVCEVEAMCFHNLPKPVAVHKTLESIFSPHLHMAQFKKHANPSQSESLLRSPQWTLPTDTLILEDRRPQVCARSWKRGEGGHLSRRQIMQPRDYVSRPEESNLQGLSGRMCAEQVDHDVTWWVSGKSPGRGRVRM